MAKPSSIVAAEQALSRLVQQWLAGDVSLGQLAQGLPPGGAEDEDVAGAVQTGSGLFQQIFAATSVGMAVFEPATCRIVAANPALSRMLGYTAEELLQLTLRDLMEDGDTWLKTDAVEQPGQTANTLERPSPHPFALGTTLECRCRPKLGPEAWVKLSLSALQKPGARPAEGSDTTTLALATLEDITPRKQAELALTANEDHYRTLMGHVPGAIYRMRPPSPSSTGPEARPWALEFISDGITRIVGFSATTLVSSGETDYNHLIHGEDSDRVRQGRAKAVIEQGAFRLEYRCLARDGQYRWLLDQGQWGQDNQQGYLDGVLIDITDLKTTEAQLAYRTSHDTLTGLPNRALFFNHLDRALQTDGSGGYPALAVLMLDVDNFKQINDCMGHSVGDQLLIEVATRLRTCLHTTDNFLARLGGDEFGVQINNVAGLMEVTQLAERIRQTMQPPVILGELSLTVSVSIGITLQGPGAGAVVLYYQAQDMLRDAEIAMYRAKQQGRAHFALYDTSMHQRAMERLELETALRHACTHREFVVYYQPIIHLATHTLAGFEALVRWQHPIRGLVPPDCFIPMSEEIGMIADIDDQVMAQACQHLAEWQRRWPQMPPIFLSLNLSTVHFTRPDLVDRLTQVLADAGLHPHQIKLEVTESALMDNSDLTHRTLHTLSQMGFGLSLDDFGTGYSSLSYLHQYPMNTLKIDRSFIMDLEQHPESSQIVGAIVAMAASLNLEVVAEGIENQAHVHYLTQLHCQYGQGYWFSKPIPVEEITPWLQGHCERTIPTLAPH